MKKNRTFCFLLAILLLCGTAAVSCTSAAQALPEPLLVTWYRQLGWGTRMQVGIVDDDGGLWFARLEQSNGLSFNEPEGVYQYFMGNGLAENIGRLDSDRLFEIESLIAAADMENIRDLGFACDAGTEHSYAMVQMKDGFESILLGRSGDTAQQNDDMDSNALYFILRELFPEVTSYAGDGRIGPAPFEPRSLIEFCGFKPIEGKEVVVIKRRTECEDGIIEEVLPEDEAKAFLDRLQHTMVVQKQSALDITGGYTSYIIRDVEGTKLGACTFFGAKLYASDGIYVLEQTIQASD